MTHQEKMIKQEEQLKQGNQLILRMKRLNKEMKRLLAEGK